MFWISTLALIWAAFASRTFRSFPLDGDGQAGRRVGRHGRHREVISNASSPSLAPNSWIEHPVD